MEKLAILYHATRVILSTFDLDKVLAEILNTVRDYFAASNAAILLLDPTSSHLYVHQHIGRTPEHTGIRVPLGSGITGAAVQLKKPINVPDVALDPRYLQSSLATRSELAIPLMVHDEVVGVLDIQSTLPDAFDSDTISLLIMFSAQASIAIENARLYSQIERRANQLEAINAIARQTTAVIDIEELLPKVCQLIHGRFQSAHVAVYLVHDSSDDGALQLRAQIGTLSGPAPSSALSQRVFATGKLATDMHPNDCSELCLPLIFYEERLGVLSLHSQGAAVFAGSELDPLIAVADIFAAAIKNCQHFELTKQLAYRDGLTSIFNRRFFEERVAEEIERCKRYGSELALLMIDIDQFKTVNDTYGHLLGDDVLKQTAALFTQQLRKSDIVCRYGGEEFVILLPELGRNRVLEVADKLRRNVQGFLFPGIPRPITISIGVSHFPANGDCRHELLAAADAALYTAKQSGRNQVVLATASASTPD
ncbi:MAG: diguanylate cyclase [Acidobacteriaceae bacterium]